MFIDHPQLNKKGDVVEAKVMKQINTVLPEQLREHATAALQHCKDVCKYSINWHPKINHFNLILFLALKYKDHCEKAYYSTKCMYEFNPQKFVYP